MNITASNVHNSNFFLFSFLEIETSERKWSYGDVSAISCRCRQHARQTRERIVAEINRLSVVATASGVLGATALSGPVRPVILKCIPDPARALQEALSTTLADAVIVLRCVRAPHCSRN
jgi:hypothetical protein